MKTLRKIMFCLAAWATSFLFAAPLAAEQFPDPRPDHWYKKIVDIDYVRPYAVIPPREDGILIDARDTARRYEAGHIPGAINLPAKQFDDLAPQLLPSDKSKLIIFYCDGIECKLSHMAADDADDLGYTNIRVYVGGFPEWFRQGNPYAVSAAHLAKLIDTGEASVLIDVRDPAVYARGHLATAINLPAAQFAPQARTVLPKDELALILFYCGETDSRLSYAVARQAAALGYRRIMLLEGGYPAWQRFAR
jgi:rhodanese-related sulfurtransferase